MLSQIKHAQLFANEVKITFGYQRRPTAVSEPEYVVIVSGATSNAPHLIYSAQLYSKMRYLISLRSLRQELGVNCNQR